jgi:hypothetical protein
MRQFFFPTFLTRSCTACVVVAYLVLLGLILWLIIDFEMPLIAPRWHP